MNNNNNKLILYSIYMFLIGSMFIFLINITVTYNIISLISVIFIIGEIVLICVIAKQNKSKFSIVYKILFLWLIYLFIYTLLNIHNIDEIISFFLNVLPSFFIILFAYIKPHLGLLNKIIKLSYYFALIYICGFFMFFDFFYNYPSANPFEIFAKIFAAPSAIILLSAKYHTNRYLMISLLANILAFIMSLFLARRNLVLYFGSIIVISGILYILVNPNFRKKYIQNILTSILVIIIPFLLFVYIHKNPENFELFFKRSETGFASRESIIDEMVTDFNRTPLDWIIGRGFLGGYNSLYSEEGNYIRTSMENGYLYFILKGGFILLFLILFVAISAIYKGLFKSNNILSKAFGCLAIIYLIDMVGFGLLEPNLKFIILFLAMGWTNSKSLCRLRDTEIIKILSR